VLVSSGVFRGLNVNCGDGSLYVRDDILEAIYTRLRFMTECHPFVLILRYDLRFPQHVHFSDYRHALQNFMNSFSVYLKRRKIDYHYVWVKEIESSANPHYHCVFIVSVDQFGSYVLNREAQSIWSRICSEPSCHASESLLHCCPRMLRNGSIQWDVLISMNDPNFEVEFGDIFYWLSYLAKTNTKNLNPGRGDRWWGSSQFR
jgi:hypothetical protein